MPLVHQMIVEKEEEKQRKVNKLKFTVFKPDKRFLDNGKKKYHTHNFTIEKFMGIATKGIFGYFHTEIALKTYLTKEEYDLVIEKQPKCKLFK